MLGTMKRRSTNEHGAATVEFALLAILLFMLIFGGISAAISISQANALQTAAREGVRFGATLPTADTAAGLDDIISVAISAATGDLGTSVPGRRICASFGDGSAWISRTLTGTATTPVTGSASCFTDGRPAGGEERVQVVVERDTTIEAIVFSTDVTISGEAVARYER